MKGLIFEILLKIPIAFIMCELLLRKEPNFKRIYIFVMFSLILYGLLAFCSPYMYMSFGHISLLAIVVFFAAVLQKLRNK